MFPRTASSDSLRRSPACARWTARRRSRLPRSMRRKSRLILSLGFPVALRALDRIARLAVHVGFPHKADVARLGALLRVRIPQIGERALASHVGLLAQEQPFGATVRFCFRERLVALRPGHVELLAQAAKSRCRLLSMALGDVAIKRLPLLRGLLLRQHGRRARVAGPMSSKCSSAPVVGSARQARAR